MPWIKYGVDIHGHRPPFKWRLFCQHQQCGPVKYAVEDADGDPIVGEADTMERAAFDALAAAETAYDELLHENTVETVELLQCVVDLPEEQRPRLSEANMAGESRRI